MSGKLLDKRVDELISPASSDQRFGCTVRNLENEDIRQILNGEDLNNHISSFQKQKRNAESHKVSAA